MLLVSRAHLRRGRVRVDRQIIVGKNRQPLRNGEVIHRTNKIRGFRRAVVHNSPGDLVDNADEGVRPRRVLVVESSKELSVVFNDFPVVCLVVFDVRVGIEGPSIDVKAVDSADAAADLRPESGLRRHVGRRHGSSVEVGDRR